MKLKLKSAVFMGLCLLGLAGCGNIEWPHVFSGSEVPPDVLNAPQKIDVTPQPGGPAWLRLGDVPARPTDFPTQSQVDQNMQQMEDDRAQGQSLQKQIESEPPIATPAPQAVSP